MFTNQMKLQRRDNTKTRSVNKTLWLGHDHLLHADSKKREYCLESAYANTVKKISFNHFII